MSARAWWSGSLRRRLLLAAALWISLALMLVGLLLVALFRHHVEQELAARAAGPLDTLAASLTVELPQPGQPPRPPQLRLSEVPDDDAFRQPFSGAYWWVVDGDTQPLRSRSWWDARIPAPDGWGFSPLQNADIGRFEARGPRGQPLVIWARRVELGAWERPLIVAVGLDVTRLEGMTRRYAQTVALALGALALALWGATWWQVRLGLAPLARLQQALVRLRSGQEQRLAGRFPSEVQPLVDELHAMLADNDRLVRQAREQTANLAHALKTPLAVLGNLSAFGPGPQIAEQDTWRQQLGLIQRQIDLHLARARAATASRNISRSGQRCDVIQVIDALLRTLHRLHTERGIQGRRLGISTPALAAIDADVLHEVLGNVLDNAFQWARHQVLVSVHVVHADPQQPLGLQVMIDDDGPGIPTSCREQALQRGGRLDETRPGSGLGLAIAAELIELAHGSLQLDTAPQGGLRVRISLPVRPIFQD